MTVAQARVSDIYGITSIVFLFVVVFYLFLRVLYNFIVMIFYGTYKHTGEDQKEKYSEVPSINAYVPRIVSEEYNYPLIACKLDRIDNEFIGWEDPDRGFEFYNLTHDVEKILGAPPSTHVFSEIQHWPPEENPTSLSQLE
mmetsp:Transcript_6365/g.9254  ORF Transcript_6365/g.9254 Transcript_6365/m.9254 type:complete len:141 (+) Transcript_6365:3-425(+)